MSREPGGQGRPGQAGRVDLPRGVPRGPRPWAVAMAMLVPRASPVSWPLPLLCLPSPHTHTHPLQAQSSSCRWVN